MHYLYKITNKRTNKIYIGQTIDEGGRWKQHKYFGRHPEQTGQYIHRAMNKYGVDSFSYETIATCKSPEDADWMEEQLTIRYNSVAPNGYNLHHGGHTRKGFKHSETTKAIIKEKRAAQIMTPESNQKRSEALIGRTSPMKGKSQTDHQREIARSRKGMKRKMVNGKRVYYQPEVINE